MCRHVPGVQLGEHTREQFMPKYPSIQASSSINTKQNYNVKYRFCYSNVAQDKVVTFSQLNGD